MSTIKFRQYYITDGVTKARVSYMISGRTDGRECVTIYDKDWSRDLGKIFKESYINDTDSMTDYFDQGHVCLFADSPFYTEALRVAQVVRSKGIA